ncbi:N-6 DNA methylase [Psychrobacter sp. ANT_WB68]|uniref:N-6 DNA methylase n=1 Tax=Psychrobacter sp. ANT_WB68 TaxID=2597355 RepID=UPI0011F0D76F|nr:N-6 DNA methylase [Psychrobacter sp. ANT_WB68]KAA0913102.1 N-6 DNA methylase [Psychrobacter sp. ANT_WB68]
MQKYKTRELVMSLYDLMHQHGIRKHNEVALKLMTILVLSKQDKLPNGLKLSQSLAEYKGEWLALMDALKASEDSQIQRVFSYDNALEDLPLPFIHSAISTLLKYQDITLESPAVDSIRTIISNFTSSTSEGFADFSVYLLANALLGDKSGKTTYLMSPASLPLAIIASEESKAVCYETINQSGMIADALSLMSKNRFEVSYSDALDKPAYITSKNELKTFDHGVSFSPMGVMVPKHISDNIDTYDRFIIPTKKVESANILHLIKQCRGTVVVSVPEGFLYSTMEKDLRGHLVDKGMLKAVISLPSGIWTGTAVKTSLLLIEPNGNNEAVRFIDVTGEEFIEKTTRRLLSLSNIDIILNYLASDKELDCAASVSSLDIQKNDYDLSVGRYLLDPKEKKVNKILEAATTVTLDSIVRFERGLSVRPDEGDYTVLEVGASELNDIGDISTPTKEANISESERVKNQTGFLQPNDIIFILKGSAGKLGIVPEDIPTTGDKCWMVNRSAIVIRTTSDKVNPKVLYAYLKSDIGQTQISRLIKGATIPNISLKELKQIPVIVPSLEEQEQAIACIDKSRETQQAIEQLLLEQYARQSELWSL